MCVRPAVLLGPTSPLCQGPRAWMADAAQGGVGSGGHPPELGELRPCRGDGEPSSKPRMSSRLQGASSPPWHP